MSEAERLAAYHVDKTGWPEGPWMQEPDRVQWRTVAGLPGLIVRHPSHGYLCGYAGVPPGHPLHGRHVADDDLPLHGDINYSARCQDDGPVCHVPEPGEPDDVWWFGFDCNHWWDHAPHDPLATMLQDPDVRTVLAAQATDPTGRQEVVAAMNYLGRHKSQMPGTTYRTVDEVRRRVESLASALVDFGR